MIKKIIKVQVELAKNHGIYGFAIYYNLENKKEINYILDNLAFNKFPFLLIWNNSNLENLFNKPKKQTLNKRQLYDKSLIILIKNMQKYLNKEIYIKN